MAELLQFWFEFASSYSYLAALRVEDRAARHGAAVAWQPFLLGPIFAEQGWDDSPFNLYPAKGRYMWRDLERLCEKYGLPFRRPSAFPRSGLRAARVACAVRAEAWLPDFVRAVFRANFAEDRAVERREVLGEILAELGRDAGAVLERAEAPDAREQLRAQTRSAVEFGVFGAPSFVVGRELFWGHDRLEDALDWWRAARSS